MKRRGIIVMGESAEELLLSITGTQKKRSFRLLQVSPRKRVRVARTRPAFDWDHLHSKTKNSLTHTYKKGTQLKERGESNEERKRMSEKRSHSLLSSSSPSSHSLVSRTHSNCHRAQDNHHRKASPKIRIHVMLITRANSRNKQEGNAKTKQQKRKQKEISWLCLLPDQKHS